MNSLIEEIFDNFIVNNVSIPVSFLRYTGNKTTYVIYNQLQIDTTFYGDNELLSYMDYYDFDIYSKGNYLEIVKELKNILEQNGFLWQPSMTSSDMYEDDTGYFHKTLCFAIERNNKITEVIPSV